MDTDSTGLAGGVRTPGRYRSACRVPSHLLKPDRYSVSVLSLVDRRKMFEAHEGVMTFDVSDVGYHLTTNRRGVITPVLTWTVDRLDGSSGAQDA